MAKIRAYLKEHPNVASTGAIFVAAIVGAVASDTGTSGPLSDLLEAIVQAL